MGSWSAASLLGSIFLGDASADSHRRKRGAIERLLSSLQVLVLQQTRGTDMDLAELGRLAPSLHVFGFFPLGGAAHGIVWLVVLAILAHFLEMWLDVAVPGRLPFLRR